MIRGQRPETGLRRTEERPGSSSRRSPVKSSSLGSLASEAGQQLPQLGGSRCSSSVSCHSLTAAGPAALVSGPSSSSSAGIIVARTEHRQVPGLADVMRKLSMDILETDSDHDPHLNIAPDTQSTVSTMEDESVSVKKPVSSKNSSSSSPPEKPKSVWNSPQEELFSNFKTFDQDKESFR